MKKIISILLVISLLLTNVFVFADGKLVQSLSNHTVTLVENRTCEIGGVIFGTLVYDIDGEAITYKIVFEDGQRIVKMEKNNELIEKLSFEKETGSVSTETGVVLATFHDDSDDIKPNMGGTIYSETPIHGSSSEYNRLLSTEYGNVRFSEALLAAVLSGAFSLASGLIIAALLANPKIGLVVGAIVSAIFAGLTYNPKPAAYFISYRYGHKLPKYYKYIQKFYWDPSYTYYCDKNIYYTSEW